MIHDTDLLNGLVARIKAADWIDSSKIADVRRVWGGDVHLSVIPAGQILVQLWPQSQVHNRRERAGAWSPTISLSIGFYFRVESQTIAEVDAALKSFDGLLVGPDSNDLLDVIDVTRDGETVTFVREPQVTWSVRPDRERLQRMVPSNDQEQYTGICQCQAEMTYSGYPAGG